MKNQQPINNPLLLETEADNAFKYKPTLHMDNWYYIRDFYFEGARYLKSPATIQEKCRSYKFLISPQYIEYFGLEKITTIPRRNAMRQ